MFWAIVSKVIREFCYAGLIFACGFVCGYLVFGRLHGMW